MIRKQEYLHAARDFERCCATLSEIRTADPGLLGDFFWLAQKIREFGLIENTWSLYGDDLRYANGSKIGMAQKPHEFACWLLHIAQIKPASYVEIGCWSGGTAMFAAAYLSRMNPAFQLTTIDKSKAFIFYKYARRALPINYVTPATSFNLQNRVFDVAFIDGDHSYEWTALDFLNLGCHATICGFHDITPTGYDQFNGGVHGFWNNLNACTPQDAETFEIIYPDTSWMGIGVHQRRNAAPFHLHSLEH